MNYNAYSEDRTVDRKLIKHYKNLIADYVLVKAKQHPNYKFAKDFYKDKDICPQNFLKYYNRYLNESKEESLLPQKRGPKYKTIPLGIDKNIQDDILDIRKDGHNKYVIFEVLKLKYGSLTPSPSTIYNIFKKNGVNKVTVTKRELVQKIIKEKIGDMGHIDCYYLPKGIIDSSGKKDYLVCIIDDHGRLAWAERISDLQSLTVMFGLLRCFQTLKVRYSIVFKEALTDNGPEFGGTSKFSEDTTNPCMHLFHEMGIKHRKIKPYRPQTNGKVERFWRTLNEEFLDGAVFKDYDEFDLELAKYLIYYNEYRPHQGINGKKPIEMIGEKNDKNE